MTTTLTKATEPQLVRRAPAWLLPVALLAAASISAIALFDAGTHGITGQYSRFSDGSHGWEVAFGGAVHGVGYLVLAAVLVLRSAEIDGGSRVVGWFRRLTAVAMGVLGAVFLLGTALQSVRLDETLGAVGSIAFLAMFLCGAGLGIALLTTGRRTPAAWLLTGILVAVALMVVLGFTAPTWVHPAYPETAVHFGAALLALPQPRTRASGRTARPA